MPVDPEIDDAGPIREHKGTGAFSHIVSNEPKPMMSDGMPSSATVNEWIAVAGGHKDCRAGTAGLHNDGGGTVEERNVGIYGSPDSSVALLHPSKAVSLKLSLGTSVEGRMAPCCQGKRGGSVSVFAMNRSRGLKRVDYFSAT
jgi:hypothetical protein